MSDHEEIFTIDPNYSI